MMSTKKKPKKPKPLAKTPPPNKITAVHQSFSGPLPHPDLLRHYNEILPGVAERIFSMAEAEAEHQHAMESVPLQYTSKETKR